MGATHSIPCLSGAPSGTENSVSDRAHADGGALIVGDVLARQGEGIDTRYHPSAAVRRQLNKVFPTHWSFLLGEIAL